MSIIALCMNVPELDQGGFRDYQTCLKYPGSLGAYFAYRMMRSSMIFSGSEILHAIEEGVLNPNQVTVVQEELNPQGHKLIEMGAEPRVLICMESPLYAPRFYDTLDELKPRFRHQILFGNLGDTPLYFPSFDEMDIPSTVPWKERKFLCSVMSNKHYGMLESVYGESRSFQNAVKTQLHGYRLWSIKKYYIESKKMDLYGKGWGEGALIPDGKKIDTIRQYQYCLCPENIMMPGYVTEKIIDALVAGCVPIYRGATDIGRYVPRDLFLQDVPEKAQDQHESLVSKGRDFLQSREGRRFSYQSFARTLLERCLGVGFEYELSSYHHDRTDSSAQDGAEDHHLSTHG